MKNKSTQFAKRFNRLIYDLLLTTKKISKLEYFVRFLFVLPIVLSAIGMWIYVLLFVEMHIILQLGIVSIIILCIFSSRYMAVGTRIQVFVVCFLGIFLFWVGFVTYFSLYGIEYNNYDARIFMRDVFVYHSNLKPADYYKFDPELVKIIVQDKQTSPDGRLTMDGTLKVLRYVQTHPRCLSPEAYKKLHEELLIEIQKIDNSYPNGQMNLKISSKIK